MYLRRGDGNRCGVSDGVRQRWGTVIVADIAADDAHRTVSGIIAAGGDARYVSCDVADSDAVDAMMEDILATEGRLDVVHANAGLESTSAATDVSLAEWHRVVGVNLTGVFLVCRAGLRHMYRQGSGVLVITSSPHALATVPDAAAYAASKGGVHALTRALALEAAPRGIRVNALVPGTIDTPMVRREVQVAADPGAQLARLAASHPLGRLGRTEELGVRRAVPGQRCGLVHHRHNCACRRRAHGCPAIGTGLAL